MREVENNKKVFFMYVNSKGNTRENMGPLLSEAGAPIQGDAEKMEMLNAFFASVFAAKIASRKSQTLDIREGVWRNYDFPLVEGELVTDH